MRIYVNGTMVEVTGKQGPAGPDGSPIGTVISFMGSAAPEEKTGLLKQESVPRWQAGPVLFTRITRASRSQSAVTSTMCWTFPLVSPLRHSSCRERDQKQVRPSFMLISRLSRLI